MKNIGRTCRVCGTWMEVLPTYEPRHMSMLWCTCCGTRLKREHVRGKARRIEETWFEPKNAHGGIVFLNGPEPGSRGEDIEEVEEIGSEEDIPTEDLLNEACARCGHDFIYQLPSPFIDVFYVLCPSCGAWAIDKPEEMEYVINNVNAMGTKRFWIYPDNKDK